MKHKVLLIISGLFFFCSCRGSRPALIPEISPPLIQEDVFVYSGDLAGNILFPCAAGIGWVDQAGKIVTWNAEKRTAGVLITLPFPVKDPPFHQGECLVLKDPAVDRILLFDLAELKVRAELPYLRVSNILGVDRDCLVYQDGEHLVVNFWEKPAGMVTLNKPGEKYFNCYFTPERILISTRDNLFTFFKKKGEFQQTPLPVPAASPLFCDGENIYYGSSQRQLVKFSLTQKRLIWKMRLGRTLERQPFAFAGCIVANPADNNVLQVNWRGSVRWWLALKSTMRFDLVTMNDNLAAVLLNREIKFIDLFHKKVTVFKSRGNPSSNPLALGHDLYFMLQEGKTCKLQRVGNHYGIDVAMDPAKVRWTGQSIRFFIQSRNLLMPTFNLLISDREGQTVLSKSAEAAERMQLAWIPPQPGKYLLKVTAKGINRKADAEMSFQVLDPRKIISGFYLHF